MASEVRLTPQAPADITTPPAGKYFVFLNSAATDDLYKKDSAGVSTPVLAAAGTVTSVAQSFTGGLISVAGSPITTTGTLALTVAGTSGGVPYFSSASTWASSGVLAANSILIGGGAGAAPSSITTGTGVVTALGVNVGSAGAFVVFNGAGGTPSSLTLTNATGLPLTTGVTGVLPTANGGTAVNIASAALVLGTASSAAGQLTLSNATNAFTQTIRGTNPVASITYDLPTTAPTAGQVLQSTAPVAGVATLSWATASSGITVGTTTITSGTSRRLGYNLAGVYQEAANELYFESASPYAHVFAAGRTGVITGLDNTFFGREAGKLITTGTRNTFIGSVAGNGSPSSISSSTLVGFLAGGNNPGSGLVAVGITTGGITSTGSGVAIGNDANVGNGASQTAVGPTASTLGSSSNSTALGSSALASGTYGAIAIGANNTATQSGAMALGYSADATHLYSIAFGYNATTTAANQLMVGNSDASFGGSSGITDICFGNGDAATSAASPTIRATSGSGTNNAGANITKAGGKGTGTAAGGNNVEQTSVKTSSGTTLQSLTDRHNIVGKYVDITGGVATTFANLALATSSTIAGGVIVYTVEANDGTDFQSLTGTAPYSVVNKAGTLTYVLGTDVQSSACSAGTLTGTLSLTASGTTMSFQMNAVSSLVETVLRVSFQVLNNFGQAIVTAA